VAKKKIDYGYKKLSGYLKTCIRQDSNLTIDWMDRLPGGSWRDDGVLKAYIKQQLKEGKHEQEDHRCKATDQEAEHGVDDRDSSYGQTGGLF